MSTGENISANARSLLAARVGGLVQHLRFVLFAATAFAVGASAGARADRPFAFDATFGRLPKNVVPLAYDIALRPNLRTRTTAGSERVRIRVRSATSKIVVNALDMTVSNASLETGEVPKLSADSKTQTMTLTFARPLVPRTYELRLAFAGKIGTQPQGLFVQPYTTSSGGKEEMLATQFESTDARRMFPSWDEPAFRATYRLHVTVPRDYTAVSNTRVESEVPRGAQKTVSFARTPSMSSYLVVLAAGRFSTISRVVDGISVRVVAPRDRIEHGRYALDAASRLLAYYDAYFAFKYPLSKLDLIDVPGGFPGAMENWGGITFDESALLFDPKLEPDSAKEDIFQTIAHEMSHQWTGDLVTMDWWSGLWLNESFADWMQTKASDHFNPTWHLWDRVESQVQGAMRTDQQSTTHAVSTPVEDETQAAAAFDEITYQKGGAVIRMMEQYLGEDTFRDGVRTYVRKRAYGNATGADLWSSLGAVAHRDVGALVDPWIATPGVPVVDASATCSGSRRSLALSQHRFLVEPGQQSSQRWSIPVALEIAGKTSYTLLVGPSATVDAGACGDPLVVNAGALGYYRVDLDTAGAGALIANFPSLGVAERARAIGDTGALMLAGAAPPQRLFASIAAVQPSDALTVWNAVLRSLRDVSDLEAGQPGRASYDAYRRRVLAPVLARVGWDALPGEGPQTESLRAELIASLGASGDTAVIAEARRRFARFASDPASLAPALREPVLNIAGTYGDAATWDTLHAVFAAAKSPVEGRQYAMALWNARDPQLAAKNLAMATNGDITSEYGAELAYYDIVSVALSGEQPAAAWSYFKAHQSEMASKLSAFERPLVVAAIAPLFWNAAPATELDALIDGTPGLPPASAARAKHAIDVRIAQRARVVPLVDAVLAGAVTK